MIQTFTELLGGGLGIQAEELEGSGNALVLPHFRGGHQLLVVHQSVEEQEAMSRKLRDLSSQRQRMILSAVNPLQLGGSTTVSGYPVPLLRAYAGRLEDQWGIGHRVMTQKLRSLLEEFQQPQQQRSYCRWLMQAIGVKDCPKTLAELQDLVDQAHQTPGSEAVPALRELAMGRCALDAVLTVPAGTTMRDTEPVVCESDWLIEAIARHTPDSTQVAVHRKVSRALVSIASRDSSDPSSCGIRDVVVSDVSC